MNENNLVHQTFVLCFTYLQSEMGITMVTSHLGTPKLTTSFVNLLAIHNDVVRLGVPK